MLIFCRNVKLPDRLIEVKGSSILFPEIKTISFICRQDKNEGNGGGGVLQVSQFPNFFKKKVISSFFFQKYILFILDVFPEIKNSLTHYRSRLKRARVHEANSCPDI